MRRVFYGYCSQGPVGDKYTVTVQDVDIQKGFERGDLLVVHFAQKQGANEPQLATSLYDTEQDTVISTDEGKFIKTVDVEITGIDKAWESGEAVIFVYTKQGDSETNYWQLVDSAPATTEVYGVTKLFDIANLNSVLGGDRTHDNEALTPAALKKFFDQLAGKDTDEEEETTPVQSAVKLIWEPKPNSDYLLGRLSIDDGRSFIDVKFPFTEEVQTAVQNLIPQVENKTHTGQLTNNGNGGGTGHETDASEPFITKMVPDNLYFGQGKGLANDGEPNPKLTLSSNGIQISAPLAVSSPTTISNTLEASTLKSTGNIQATSGGTIFTSGNIIGHVLYEGYTGSIPGTPINQIYSKILAYEPVTTAFTLKSTDKYRTDSFTPYTKNHPASDWEAIGVIGYNLSNDTNGSGASYCYFWAVALNAANNAIIYNVRNTDGKEHKVKLTVRVLYRHR